MVRYDQGCCTCVNATWPNHTEMESIVRSLEDLYGTIRGPCMFFLLLFFFSSGLLAKVLYYARFNRLINYSRREYEIRFGRIQVVLEM